MCLSLLLLLLCVIRGKCSVLMRILMSMFLYIYCAQAHKHTERQHVLSDEETISLCHFDWIDLFVYFFRCVNGFALFFFFVIWYLRLQVCFDKFFFIQIFCHHFNWIHLYSCNYKGLSVLSLAFKWWFEMWSSALIKIKYFNTCF